MRRAARIRIPNAQMNTRIIQAMLNGMAPAIVSAASIAEPAAVEPETAEVASDNVEPETVEAA